MLDVGCGTGVFAVLLADGGHEVVGVDPAAASIDVARAKEGADRVRWLCGTAPDLLTASPPVEPVDLATMTANVAMAITDEDDWRATLAATHALTRPGGHLVLETRVAAYRAWEEWNPTDSRDETDVPGVGRVESWHTLDDVSLPLVSFTTTVVLHATGETLTSRSTLRFRSLDEVEADLATAGYAVWEVRDAPDRPGREHVVVARGTGREG